MHHPLHACAEEDDDFEKSLLLGSTGQTQTTRSSSGGGPREMLPAVVADRTAPGQHLATPESLSGSSGELTSSGPLEVQFSRNDSRAGTEDVASLPGRIPSKAGSNYKEMAIHDLVASIMSKEFVDEAATLARWPVEPVGRCASHESGSVRGRETPLREPQETRLGRDLAAGLARVLMDELMGPGRAGPGPPGPVAAGTSPPPPPPPPKGVAVGAPSQGSPQAEARRAPAEAAAAAAPPEQRAEPSAGAATQPEQQDEQSVEGTPSPVQEVEQSVEGTPSPLQEAERQHETLLAECTRGLAKSLNEGLLLRSSPLSASAAESVASFSTFGSVGTDAASGLRQLATIEEEEALLSVLDRVMLDVGKDLPGNSAPANLVRQWKAARPARTQVDASRSSWRSAAAEEPPAVAAQDGSRASTRPISACSVASMQQSRSGDERQFGTEVSQALWKEICECLDEALLARPAGAVAAGAAA